MNYPSDAFTSAWHPLLKIHWELGEGKKPIDIKTKWVFGLGWMVKKVLYHLSAASQEPIAFTRWEQLMGFIDESFIPFDLWHLVHNRCATRYDHEAVKQSFSKKGIYTFPWKKDKAWMGGWYCWWEGSGAGEAGYFLKRVIWPSERSKLWERVSVSLMPWVVKLPRPGVSAGHTRLISMYLRLENQFI